jgi:hypothetical protein
MMESRPPDHPERAAQSRRIVAGVAASGMKDVPETESNHGVNDMALHKAVWVAVALAASINAHAQVAGTQPLSVTVEQSNALLQGWSVKKSVLGRLRLSGHCFGGRVPRRRHARRRRAYRSARRTRRQSVSAGCHQGRHQGDAGIPVRQGAIAAQAQEGTVTRFLTS